MDAPLLSLDDARLTLEGNAGPVEILRGISLDVRAGETLGLTGPSGSGKSSLLMLMGGLEQATGGRVLALGHDLTAMSEDQLAEFRKQHMGVVFQSFHLIPTMTALENVATPLELAGVGDAFERAEAELVTVGLSGTHPSLSGADVGRRAAARGVGAGGSAPAADPAGGRAYGQSGRSQWCGNHGVTLWVARRPRSDIGAGHPCPAIGGALRPCGASDRRPAI